MRFILLALILSFLHSSTCRPQAPPVAAQPYQAQAAAGSGVTPIPIVSFTESVGNNGSFSYSYETGNGIKFQESGAIKHVTGLRARSGLTDPNTPDEDDILVQTGSFSYTAPDGQVISLTYTADENGFQPVGDHLPTAPPIPADIQKSLSQLPQNPPQQQQGFPAVTAPTQQ